MLKFTVRTDGLDGLAKKLKRAATKAEKTVLAQVLTDTDPYVPKRQGGLTGATRIEGTQIIYPGPYARYLYYGKVMEGPKYGPKHATDKDLVYTTDFHQDAQSYWFEASKAMNMGQWLRTADKAVKHEFK